MIWYSKSNKNPSIHITFKKYYVFVSKKSLDFSKFAFQKRPKLKTFILGLFLEKPLRYSQTQKKCANIFADYEPC